MVGRFPLYTDADVQGHLVDALGAAGWDVVRGIDRFPEGTSDTAHFEEAARLGRVLVSNDEDQFEIAIQWLACGRPFTGFVTWRQAHYTRASVGDFLRAFEALAARDDPFGNYPVVHLSRIV